MKTLEKINMVINILKIIGIVMIPLSLIAGSFVCKKHPNVKQDNPVEELVEDVIEKFGGIYIDISPETKEL